MNHASLFYTRITMVSVSFYVEQNVSRSAFIYQFSLWLNSHNTIFSRPMKAWFTWVTILHFSAFVARPGNPAVLDFAPSPDFPSLQYFDFIEENSMAAKAGLRCGDFLLEVSVLCYCDQWQLGTFLKFSRGQYMFSSNRLPLGTGKKYVAISCLRRLTRRLCCIHMR